MRVPYCRISDVASSLVLDYLPSCVGFMQPVAHLKTCKGWGLCCTYFWL